jgi:hypothetical protein
MLLLALYDCLYIFEFARIVFARICTGVSRSCGQPFVEHVWQRADVLLIECAALLLCDDFAEQTGILTVILHFDRTAACCYTHNSTAQS